MQEHYNLELALLLVLTLTRYTNEHDEYYYIENFTCNPAQLTEPKLLKAEDFLRKMHSVFIHGDAFQPTFISLERWLGMMLLSLRNWMQKTVAIGACCGEER